MSDHKPEVSILLPVRNREDYVGAAIESALSQSEGDFELVISENASTDRSLEVIRSFHDPRIRLYVQGKPLSMGRNWDFVLQQARGDYAMILGSDDEIMPRHLEVRLALHRRMPEISFSFSPVEFIDSNGKRVDESSPVEDGVIPADIILGRMVTTNPFNVMGVFFRMDVVRSHQLSFDDHILTDWRLWMDLASLGGPCAGVAEVTVRYRRHASSETGTSKAMEWAWTAASLVVDFAEKHADHLREMGLDPSVMGETATRGLWQVAQRELRDGRLEQARRAWDLYRRYHGLWNPLLELPRCVGRGLWGRMNGRYRAPSIT